MGMKKAESLQCSCAENNGSINVERSRHIINAIFDSTQSCMILVSLDHRIIFLNKKSLDCGKILYGRELRVGDCIMGLQREGDEAVFQTFQENFAKAIATCSIVTCEREMHFQDQHHWFRFEFTPVYDHGNIVGVALRIVDVTERKKREQKIAAQNEQLQKISWEQSHLTRQPVATMLGLIHILDKTTLSEDNLRIVELMKKEVDKLDVIIHDMVMKANSCD